MILYILIFLAVLYLYNTAKTPKQQQTYFKYMMIFLALFVGLADMLGGYDRYIYGELFDSSADAIHAGKSFKETLVFSVYGSEFGYGLWNVLVGAITTNRYIFIMLSTFLMYFLFYRAIKQQTENPIFALIVFMALTFYFSFTYLRQMLAAAIVWQSLPYVEKRNLKMFCLWVFIAFSFHNSAIVFLPVYFIPFRKFKREWVDAVIIACLLLGLSGFSSNLFEAYADATSALERVNVQKYAVDEGFRWAYFIEAFFFYYIIRKYYSKLGNNKISIVGLNLSIIFCCILLLFLHSENGGRIGWLFMIGLYSMLTTTFAGIKKVANASIIIIVSFALFFRITYLWGENGFQILYPYKTFLTPGVRKPDRCHDVYEYDNKYDENKFYRL